MKLLNLLISFVLIAALFSCNSNKESSIKEQSKVIPGMVKTESGLQYQDLVVGTGASPTKGQTIVVHYHGTLEDGTIFDSSVQRGQPFETAIGVGRVIKGWDEGMMTMKIGGKRKLIIPADLAYGSRSVGSIPANSTLIFEVELLNIK